jgi:hypothetical protein
MPSKSDIKRLDHPWVKNLLGEIIDAVNGTWPNEFQAYILSKMLQLRIVIIQDHYEKGVHLVYDTDCSFGTEELFKKDVEVANSTGNSTSSSLSKAPTGNNTCYLLQFDPTTPHGMCHWTQYSFVHFIYLQDVTEKIADNDKKRAYKGRGGTQDIGWHPLIVDSWSDLLEEAVSDNNASIGSQHLNNDIAKDQKKNGLALVRTEMSNVDRGLVTQTRAGKGKQKDDEQGSISEGKGLGDQNSRGYEGGKKEDKTERIVNDEIATDSTVDGRALDERVISSGDRGIVAQIREGEGEKKDDVQQSSEGEGLGNLNSRGDEGGKKDDESGGNRDDYELDNQSSLGEKEDKQGSRHSTEEIVRILEDEEDEYKDLWSKIRRLPNNMKKIMLAGNKNEKMKKVKKKKANSPMESSMNDIYETSDRTCNSVSM